MASIFAIVDPLGVIPFFSALTEDMTPAEKREVISKSCLVATTTLGVFAVFGQFIFAAFGFTIPAFEIAGGILLFVVAFEMIHGERPRTKMTESERADALEREDDAIVGVEPRHEVVDVQDGLRGHGLTSGAAGPSRPAGRRRRGSRRS